MGKMILKMIWSNIGPFMLWGLYVGVGVCLFYNHIIADTETTSLHLLSWSLFGVGALLGQIVYEDDYAHDTGRTVSMSILIIRIVVALPLGISTVCFGAILKQYSSETGLVLISGGVAFVVGGVIGIIFSLLRPA